MTTSAEHREGRVATPAVPDGAIGTVRVAAVGDVHMDRDVVGVFRPELLRLPDRADLLLLAGDLTRRGTPAEARCVADEFGGLDVPVVAVLGNHDYHGDQSDDVARIVSDAGIIVLDGTTHTIDVGGLRVTVGGLPGFGGGFAGTCVSAFGEPQTKAFAGYGRQQADRLHDVLSTTEATEADVLIALTHYAPIPETLVGEPLELYPFLGSYLLGEAIDRCGAVFAFHGHAHFGSPAGTTPGGVPVRNVAYHVLGQAYGVFAIDPVRVASG